MEVKGVSSTYKTTASTPKKDLDKDAFLKILVSQLSNQDPMNAKDNSEYVAQMAQFTALEQTQNMSATIERLLVSQKVTEGTMLIDKEVEFQISENAAIKEVVKGVKVYQNSVYLSTESGWYSIDKVISVEEKSND